MRKPIHQELRGLATPRERVWAAILAQPKGQPFTKTTIQDKCNPMVSFTAVHDYCNALEKAGFITRIGGSGAAPGALGQPIEYELAKRQHEAPRVDKDGKPVTQGTGTLSMWRAMKVMKAFDYHQIVQAACVGGLVVTEQTAKAYVIALARAGYLQVLRPSKPGTPAVYRLKLNTGPHAPAITRRKCVFDRNTASFVELETVQEVADGIE